MAAAVGQVDTSAGRTTAAAPRGAVIAARMALAMVSGTLSGWLTSPVYLVKGLSAATASCVLRLRGGLAPLEGLFQQRLQRSQLEYVVGSTAAAASLAENYVGLPFSC